MISSNIILHCCHVALTEEEMNASSQRFFIQDLAKDILRNNDIQVKKDADKAFIKVSTDEKQMRRCIDY